GPLARIAASRRSLEQFESDISPAVLQYIAFSVLGLWFAIDALGKIAYTLHRWIFFGAYLARSLADPCNDPKVFGTLMHEIVELVLGIGLALGSRGIVALLARMRHGGPAPAQPEAAIRQQQEEA